MDQNINFPTNVLGSPLSLTGVSFRKCSVALNWFVAIRSAERYVYSVGTTYNIPEIVITHQSFLPRNARKLVKSLPYLQEVLERAAVPICQLLAAIVQGILHVLLCEPKMLAFG